MKILNTLLIFLAIFSFQNNFAQKVIVNSIGDTINVTDANKMRQGKWILQRGMAKDEGHYIDNKKNDVWISYGTNGKPELIEEYKNGKLDGVSFVIDNYGTLRNERHFKNGQLDGINVYYSKDGVALTKRYYKNGLLQGDFYKYYDDGAIMEHSYYWKNLKDSISTFYN